MRNLKSEICHPEPVERLKNEKRQECHPEPVEGLGSEKKPDCHPEPVERVRNKKNQKSHPEPVEGQPQNIKNQNPTTILVTGANGQLGLTIQKLKNNYPNLKFTFCNSKDLDITSKESVRNNFKRFNPDYCINCAAYTNVEQAEKEPEKAFLVNAQGVKNIAEICKEYNTTLIHISTDYVFDGKKRTPYTVNDVPNPINEYGKSKLEGEKYIQEILEKYFIVRTSWLYSKEFGKNFYRTILEKAKEGKELRITDAQRGCPTDAENLAKYILELIIISPPYTLNKFQGHEWLGEEYGIRHFSDKKEMTWYSFAKVILKKNRINNAILIKDNSYKTIAKRPMYSVVK